MSKKLENGSEFKVPDEKTIQIAAATKASEFKKLSSGEHYILEMGFKFGAEFMINYNKNSNMAK